MGSYIFWKWPLFYLNPQGKIQSWTKNIIKNL
jgi:hypothetical protein